MVPITLSRAEARRRGRKHPEALRDCSSLSERAQKVGRARRSAGGLIFAKGTSRWWSARGGVSYSRLWFILFYATLVADGLPRQTSHKVVLSRASRSKAFPFSSSREAFSQELLPSFAANWAEANALLGRSAAAAGRRFIESCNCTSWVVSRCLHACALSLHLTLGPDTADSTVLRCQVVQHDANTLELIVCAGSKLDGAPWKPLIHFEGTPKDGSGYKKVSTDRENLMQLCESHAPALSFIDLAEMLSNIPVLPALWVDAVRSQVLEDAAAEAAWEESSGTRSDSVSTGTSTTRETSTDC
jgi:hypothetical protein